MTQPSRTSGAPKTTAPPSSKPGDDDDDLSPRDRYIKGLQTAYLGSAAGGNGNGNGANANSIEALQRRWSSPGRRSKQIAARATNMKRF
jgi:hypothetical protein